MLNICCSGHGFLVVFPYIASHTKLNVRDHCTSSTLIDGKGGATASSLHTALEGPTLYMNARLMYNLHGFLHDIKWIMFHGHLDYFPKPPLGGKPNKIPGILWRSLTRVDLFYCIMCENPV